ncbi:MAG: amino acid ABC transporter permease [Devosia sp.]|nr:amino acid ABC transporter permease [Devosia sp.]
MSDDTARFVRTEMAPAERPPIRVTGLIGWLRKHLFSSIGNTTLTLVSVAFLAWVMPPLLNFLVFKAVWTDPDGLKGDLCRPVGVGACWAFISARITFFIYGFYPQTELWRPNIVLISGLVLIVPLFTPKAPFKVLNAVLFFIVLPIISFFLLTGGVFGITPVPTEKWGGLLITLVISVVGITCSIPIGILLALGRRSRLPIIKTLSILFIELWRAVPLITVLFMAAVMLPLFMPQGTTVDKLLRALVGVTLFESAYLAEVVRGGLQALPRGQYEAASSLGLSYWKSMAFVILPQAIKHVIPGIVGNFISLFKDTSLVSIVGLFDLLNTMQSALGDQDWLSPNLTVTGYIFAGLVFWVFCFSMSRYSRFLERRLDTGHR